MFTLFFNGADRTGVLTVPQTGSWTAFTTLSIEDVQLNQEDSIMRIFIENGKFNMGRLIFSASTTATAEVEASGNYLLYPSPARQELFVKNLASARNYTVLDINGRKVIGGTLQPGSSLSVAELSPGIYCLLLQGGGKKEMAGKFHKN